MFTDGMSRLTVGVSIMVALSLAVFLTIVVLLLADLFCSHLRRRRLRAAAMEAPPAKWPKHGGAASSPPHTADDASVATTTTTATHEALSSTPPFYYAHGVMCAPPSRKDLLLAIPKLEAAVWRWSPARRSSSSPSPSPPRSEPTARESTSSAYSDGFLRISNPMYERGCFPAAATGGGYDTPFDTPEDSPSRSPSGITEEGNGAFSPPLSMMRKLPPLGVLACPPPTAAGFFDGRPAVTLWPGTVATDANRASSSSSNFTTRFFSS